MLRAALFRSTAVVVWSSAWRNGRPRTLRDRRRRPAKIMSDGDRSKGPDPLVIMARRLGW